MRQDNQRPFDNFSKLHGDVLTWDDQKDIGYYPVRNPIYGKEYFEKYKNYAETPLGESLNSFRFQLVDRYFTKELIDIGIGSGSFIKYRNAAMGYHSTLGYDVNPFALNWMDMHGGLFKDPYKCNPDAITCWDSLEHIERPQDLIERVKKYIFVSIPIFRDLEHVTISKHFRRDEHCWYFTRKGLVKAMRFYGFDCIYTIDRESQLGREDILSFVFCRHPHYSNVEFINSKEGVPEGLSGIK